MVMIGRRVLGWSCLLLCLFALAGSGFSQVRSLSARHVLIRIPGYLLADRKIAEENHQACVFHAATGTWHVVPFQIDEYDESGNVTFDGDGILDERDALVFLSEDVGDRAPTDLWWENGEGLERTEIVLKDPDNPEEQGWLYIYQCSQPNRAGYFSYQSRGSSAVEDTIQTENYRLGHNDKGWMTFAAIGNNGRLNLLDRFKFHVSGGGGVIPAIALTEDTLSLETEQFVIRPVCSYRIVRSHVSLQVPPFPPINKDDHFIISFTPYAMTIQAGIPVDENSRYLLVLLRVQNIRFSVDLNPIVQGMKFYSVRNPNGVPVDGVPDTIDPLLPADPHERWVMASGPAGTIFSSFLIPPILNVAGEWIYYRDDITGGTNEGTRDSGDGASFGDMGFWLHGDALIPEQNSLSVGMTVYFLPERNQKVDFGIELAREIVSPPAVEIAHQARTVSVANPARDPGVPDLMRIFPNPAAIHQTPIQILCTVPQGRAAALSVYDALGRLLYQKELIGSAMPIRVSWPNSHSFLPAGIYFVKLQIGEMIDTQKLLIVR